MDGAPSATMTLNANNGVLTGTGTIKPGDPLFRSTGTGADIVITGTHSGPAITSLTATISFEYNTTPQDGQTDTWVTGSGEIVFNGEFTKSGGASGGFNGTTSITGVNLGGTWIATQETMGTGILKP
ncbi:hypothetical protein ACFL3H_02430 [Gemmatimonadota bacterium]